MDALAGSHARRESGAPPFGGTLEQDSVSLKDKVDKAAQKAKDILDGADY